MKKENMDYSKKRCNNCFLIKKNHWDGSRANNIHFFIFEVSFTFPDEIIPPAFFFLSFSFSFLPQSLYSSQNKLCKKKKFLLVSLMSLYDTTLFCPTSFPCRDFAIPTSSHSHIHPRHESSDCVLRKKLKEEME